MFRSATRSLVAPVARRAVLAPSVLAPVRFAPSLLVQQRTYAASALAPETIKGRIEDVLKSFEKVDASKVSLARSSVVLGGFAPPSSPSRSVPPPASSRPSLPLSLQRTAWVQPTDTRPVAHRTQVAPTASFTNDLGLDSLDAVEVVMAIEGAPRLSPSPPCRTRPTQH